MEVGEESKLLVSSNSFDVITTAQSFRWSGDVGNGMVVLVRTVRISSLSSSFSSYSTGGGGGRYDSANRISSLDCERANVSDGILVLHTAIMVQCACPVWEWLARAGAMVDGAIEPHAKIHHGEGSAGAKTHPNLQFEFIRAERARSHFSCQAITLVR
jgi:hypothetical protein